MLKVETDIITNITSRPAARAAKLVIMYVDSFTTDIIILIGNVIMYWTYQWSKMLSENSSHSIIFNNEHN
jgi:hypothetical protein